jgi:hypothetical protein
MTVPAATKRFKPGRGTTGWQIGAAVNTFEVSMLLKSVMLATSTAGLQGFGQQVADYLDDRAVNRFAYEGDEASGSWPALAPTTERIRASMGYGPDGPINIRTSEMFSAVAYSDSVLPLPGGVQVTKPNPSDITGPLEQKLITAQRGRTDNGLFPGASTPPRPVVALGERDMVEIMAKLQLYIMAATTTSLVRMGSGAAI